MPKLIVDSLDGLPEALKSEYEQTSDGKFRLKLDGEIPELTDMKDKVKEFRDNNVKLLKEAEEKDKIITKYKDVDLDEIQKNREELELLRKKGGASADDIQKQVREAVATETASLKKQIETERNTRLQAEQNLKRTGLETKLRDVAGKLKVRESATEDFLARGLRVFDLDGVAKEGDKIIYSEDKPTEPMGMEEWG